MPITTFLPSWIAGYLSINLSYKLEQLNQKPFALFFNNYPCDNSLFIQVVFQISRSGPFPHRACPQRTCFNGCQSRKASGDLGTSSWSLTPGVSIVNGPQFDRDMQIWFMLIVITRTEWSPIQSVIILVINKSDSRLFNTRMITDLNST